MHHDPHRDPRRRHPSRVVPNLGSSSILSIRARRWWSPRIDRLARSMHDLQVIVATLKDKGAHLAATEQPVDTSTAAGKAFFDMLGVFAEFETNLRCERQAEGIVMAKQRGAYRGRPPRIDMEAISHRLAGGQSPTEIALELGISRGTVYKARANMKVYA